jgi:hypothetical protein
MENQQPSQENGRTFIFWVIFAFLVGGITLVVLGPLIIRLRGHPYGSRSQALTHQLALAYREYMLEYRKWPTNTAETVLIDRTMLSTVLGKNPDTNPRNTVYIEISPKFLNSKGHIVDGWKRPLWVRFDHDFDNYITDPLNPTNSIKSPILVWSTGGKYPDVTNWR